MSNDATLKLGFLDLRVPSQFTITSDPTPGTEFTFTHNLGRTPSGYMVASQNGPGTLYDSGTSWTDNEIFLKSDGPSVTFVVYFI